MKDHLVKVLALLLLFMGGYIVGNFIPLKIFEANFSDENYSKGEYYRVLVASISALITLLAVVVALFKDDFREYWKRPVIEFYLPAQLTIEETESSIDTVSGSDTLKATKYTSRIEVNNEGNRPALNAEIYLDKLEFIPKDASISQNIDCTGTPLQWNGTDSLSIIIPPGGKKLVNIAEITPPIKFSTPDSRKTTEPARLIIGNISNTSEQPKGKWLATFSLYAQNHRPTNFKLEIEWTGIWKNRLTELNNQFKIMKKA